MLRPTYPILTRRLLLRPFAMDDLAGLHAIQSRLDVTRYLMWGPRSLAEVRKVLAKRARTTTLEDEGDALNLAMTLPESGALVGDVSLRWVSAEHRQGEIGFVLHPDHHGKGFAGEAGAVMLRLGFEGLGLHRVVGRCDARNTASAKVMERLGMRREAHFRQNEIVKGEWTDELVYAMLADEWPTARARPA
jgi:RimJ/RimL family protein N-acetyltransferase